MQGKNDFNENKNEAIFIVSYSFWVRYKDKGSVFPAHIIIKHKIPKTEDDFEKFMEEVMKKIYNRNPSVNENNFLGINSISRFDIEE